MKSDNQVNTADLTLNQKIKLISKLAKEGYDTEKKLSELTVDDMLEFDDITIPDIHKFKRIKQIVKSNKLLSYLNGVDESEAK